MSEATEQPTPGHTLPEQPAQASAPVEVPVVQAAPGTLADPAALPPAATTAPPDEVPPARTHEESGWVGSVQSLVITVVIAVFVITFIVQAFQIPSESMENTLLIGDYLLVDKAHYGPGGAWSGLLPYKPIERGDIIVFRYPISPAQHFVKRVIGVPGDRVRLLRKRVYVNGQLVDEPYVVFRSNGRDTFRDNFPDGDSAASHIGGNWYLQMHALTEDHQLIVPRDSYFVMGDNRDESLDSRYWGFVPRENVLGRPLMIYWSVRASDPADGDERQDGKLTRLRRNLRDGWHELRWTRMFTLVH